MSTPQVPALVRGTVTHARLAPRDHRLRHRVYQWLVDVDALPQVTWWLRPFATFRAADHIGDPHATISANLRRFLWVNGIDPTGHRIVMLANARVLGHTFDPLSVFWVVSPTGDTTAVVAEVHNTYGERHAYLLNPDDSGRDTTDKQFYVSPFFDVTGQYDLRFVLDTARVVTEVRLRREGRIVFTASFRGSPEPLTTRSLARTALTHPLMTWRVTALIRLHGIALWLRRHRVHPRPQHHPQEGT